MLRIRVPALFRATPAASYPLLADAGFFTLTGQDAGLRVTRRLVADVGVFTLAGQDAGLRVTRRLVADVGVFTLVGQSIELVRPLSGGSVVARLLRRRAIIARLIIRGDDNL